MTLELHRLTLDNAPILRVLATRHCSDVASLSALAAAAGRDPSNTRRSLKLMEDAGLIHAEPLANGLTAVGVEQLAALERAENPDSASGEGGFALRHDQLAPSPLNPRRDFDTASAEAALDALRMSILDDGLLQNLVVRAGAEDGRFVIIAGENRWRAIGQAIADGDWPEDRPIRCELRQVDDRQHRILALIENVQRRDLTPSEKAQAYEALATEGALSNAQIAERIGKTPEHVQQHRRFLKLAAVDLARLDLPRDHPDHLSVRDARDLATAVNAATPAPTTPVAPVEDAQTEPEPIDPVAALNSSLTDREALLLVEIADKAEVDPDPELGTEHYTRVQSAGAQGACQTLVGKGLVGIRQRGMTVFVRPRLFTSGLKEWLDALGFYISREAVLFDARQRVLGVDEARRLRDESLYATAWLNPTGDPMQDGGSGFQPGQMEAARQHRAEALDTPASRADPDAEAFDGASTQPDLIEPTEAEKAARIEAEREAHADARARAAADQMARQAGDWMAFARGRGASDYFNPPPADAPPNPGPEGLCVALYRALSNGEPAEAAALLAALQVRAGVMGARSTLAQMPLDLIVQVVTDARAPSQAAEDAA